MSLTTIGNTSVSESGDISLTGVTLLVVAISGLGVRDTSLLRKVSVSWSRVISLPTVISRGEVMSLTGVISVSESGDMFLHGTTSVLGGSATSLVKTPFV